MDRCRDRLPVVPRNKVLGLQPAPMDHRKVL